MKAKLFAAEAELRIRQRQLNAAQRGYEKVLRTIDGITRKLEGVEPTPKHVRRADGAGDAGTRKEEPMQGDVLAETSPEVQRLASVAGED
jgi:hypothetical protein